MYTCRCRVALLTIALSIAVSAILTGPAAANGSVALEYRRVSGASLHVITADLNDPRIRIDIGLPAKGLYHSEPFAKMVERRSPVAAVTGTYFDTRSLMPVGTIIASGRTFCVSNIGTTVCFTGATRVTFVSTAKGETCRLSGMDCVLRTGPRLLDGGRYVLNARREGFRHPGLFGSHKRVAMGVTRSNKLLLVVVRTPVTFGRTAAIMKSLGAVDAACLDGGTSSAMSYRGRLVCRPGRSLTNILEVHWSPAFAARANSDRIARTKEPAAADWLAATADGASASVLGQTAPEVEITFPETYCLRLAQGWRPLFPVNRAKLAGLKGLENT
jgi:hypothetical protein